MNGVLDFTEPPVDPARVSATGRTMQPPVRGRTTISRHASATGAAAVVHTWTSRQSTYLQALEAAGAATDHEMAAVLGWQLCSVNSVRGALGDRIVSDGFDVHAFVDASGVERRTKRTRWRIHRDRGATGGP